MTILTREQIQDFVDANWYGLHGLPDSFVDLLETAWAYWDLREQKDKPEWRGTIGPTIDPQITELRKFVESRKP